MNIDSKGPNDRAAKKHHLTNLQGFMFSFSLLILENFYYHQSCF